MSLAVTDGRATEVAPAFVLRGEIAAQPARVIEFLSDLHNIQHLHPLIASIRELDARPDRPAARHYEIVDIIPVGFFEFRTRYRAVIEAVSPSELWATAWQSPGIRLDTRYELEAFSGGTRLTERVWMKTPIWLPGLHGFVRRQAEAAHRETLERLADHLADS